MAKTIIIIGGGAAGFFGAVTAARLNPSHRVILIEKTRQLLSKVRISGGGRCNVTHHCFEPARLITNYPRGSQELRGPFSRFQPKDTIRWFEERGVKLKTEEDGRMFPVTDQSETIIQCLLDEARKTKVDIWTECGLKEIERKQEGFFLKLSNGKEIEGHRVLMATGSSPAIYPHLEALGHHIIPLVPSLFTFNIPTSPMLDLAGISVARCHVQIKETALDQIGPVLLTHWGLSGPAILKLSAWGARELHERSYQAEILIDWLPDYSEDALKQLFHSFKIKSGGKHICSDSPFSEIPKQLWKKVVQLAGIQNEIHWAVISKVQIHSLIQHLKKSLFLLQGKTTYKQEFVTCGGVSLKEIDFKTMESRLCSGLYLAGEILNIDGVTGGFNFQNAWTTGWIAGHSLSSP